MNKTERQTEKEKKNVNLATQKADNFALQNDKSIRAQAKQAILHELNSQMHLRAERLKMKETTAVYGRPDPDHDHIRVTGIQVVPLAMGDLHGKGRGHLSQPAVGNVKVNGLDPTGDPGPGAVNRLEQDMPQHLLLTKRSSACRGFVTSSPKQSSSPSRGAQTTPRKRRRAGAKQRNVVQDYRPGYAWNRGGRLKELRIRCIARKFLDVWIRKTFGRVLPSKATQHYRLRLTRQCFSEWYDMWWVARKEWGLSIRAELHNRYRLWNNVWHIWRSYTLDRRTKTVKRKLAEKYANQKRLQAVLEGWKSYVQMRHSKKSLYKRAGEIYTNNLIQGIWSNWCDRHRARLREKSQDEAALQHWASHLTHKVWLEWRSVHHERIRQRDQQDLAGRHHHRSVLHSYLDRWMEYVAHRHVKKEQLAYADRVHQHGMLRQYYDRWQNRVVIALRVAQHQDRITGLSERSRCRRVIVHWRLFVHQQKEERLQERMALFHYRDSLLKASLGGWKLLLMQRNVKRMRMTLAADFQQKSMLRRAWGVWMERMEETEETQIKTKTRKANRHFRLVLQKKMLTRWQHYLEWRRHREARYVSADAYYRERTLPECLERWKSYVKLSKQRKQLAEAAGDFRRENLLARFFYVWSSAYQQSQDERMMTRMAILHHQDQLRANAFRLWKTKMEAAVRDALHWEAAEEHHRGSMCRRMLLQWRNNVLDKKQGIVNDRKAARHRYLSLMGKVWTAWSKYVRYRKGKAVQTKKAREHHGKHLLATVWSGWHHYQEGRREIYLVVETLHQRKNAQTLRWAVHKWHANVHREREEKLMLSTAQEHYRCRVLTLSFDLWHTYAVNHAHSAQQTQSAVDKARTILDRGVLLRSFTRWRVQRDEALLARLKYEQAAEHHGSTVLRHCWAAWKEHNRQCLRKQLLLRQSMWFHNTRITARFFLRWKRAHAEAADMEAKTSLALWHWCLALQRKVLEGWYLYAAERKRKAARVAAALEQRRLRLLKTSATQWLLVASDLADMRQKFAAERGAQNYYKLHQSVLRCASHWRQVTARRKLARRAAPHGAAPTKPRPWLPQVALAAPTAAAVSARLQIHTAGAGSRDPSSVPPMRSDVSPDRLAGLSGRGPAGDGGECRGLTGMPLSRRERTRPRQPDFLMESLKREGLYAPSPDKKDAIHSNETDRTSPSGSRSRSSHGQTKPGAYVNADPGRAVDSRVRVPHLTDGVDSLRDVTDVKRIARKPSSPRSDGQLDQSARSAGEVSEEEDPRPPVLQVASLTDYVLERSDELDISAVVPSEIETEVENVKRRHQHDPEAVGQAAARKPTRRDKPVKTARAAGSASTNKPQLLPPTAFMRHRDGTPFQQTHPELNGGLLGPGASILDKAHAANAVHGREATPEHPGMTDGVTADGGSGDASVLTKANVYSSPAEEMTHIRKELMEFQQCKLKLKRSRDQHQQLIGWLSQQGDNDLQHHDLDLAQIQEEVKMLGQEIEELTTKIATEKPRVQLLTLRVQQLLPSSVPNTH